MSFSSIELLVNYYFY